MEWYNLEWDSNIPFDDLLLIKVKDLFPNFAIPNIELRVYIDPAGLAWCTVDPQAVYDHKLCLEINYKLPKITYKHYFTQINNASNGVTEFTVNGENVDVTSGKLTLVCNLLRVTDLSSHMARFGFYEQERHHRSINSRN